MQQPTAASKKPELSKQAQDLIAHIRTHGGISVAEYMQRAVSAYYAHARPFGKEGDFVTSPDISQLFGEMIGLWCADIWMQAGKPARVMLAELGPGRGTLMADILRTARNWPEFHAALSVHLVETSPQLRAQQAAALGDAVCAWHDDIGALPQDAFSLIVSNEFFDALPVRQFIRRHGAWQERYVQWDEAEETLCFTCRAADDAAAHIPPTLQDAPEGSVFECSPQSRRVAQALGAHIAKTGGACLAIDYGHAQSGFGDTLQAVSRHQYADVLDAPGMRDVTAHVDFGALVHAAAAGGADVLPVTTQGKFLNALGIQMRAQKLAARATPQQQAQIPLDLHRLTAPSAMGDLFKVICWQQKGSAATPAGFEKGE
ncbi:MAG: SAM-dependent methyltransferase [Alphaproteobacteria bacterium]|nr:SAM-dependent methyltransferase [Alphaproteobacteria bacterium]